MTTYTVHKAVGSDRVIIALNGFGPSEDGMSGYDKVGSFEHSVDAEGNNETQAVTLNHDGDHFMISKAKEVLRDSGDFDRVDLDKLTYLDQASNAPVHADDSAYSTEVLEDSGGEQHPEVSTQLGGVGSEENNSQIETGGDQTGAGSEGGEDTEDEQEDEAEDGDDGETVKQLKERIAGITDKDELQKAYDDEKAGKNRSTAIAAIEARAEELNAE